MSISSKERHFFHTTILQMLKHIDAHILNGRSKVEITSKSDVPSHSSPVTEFDMKID